MKNTIFPFLFSIILSACSMRGQPVSKQVLKKLEHQQDSLSKIFPSVVKPLIESDWLSFYSSYLIQKYPEFTIDYAKQDYVVVPELNIPVDSLEKDNTDILHYLAKGNLKVNYSTIYILENKLPVGTFKITGKHNEVFNPGTFHESFKESQVIELINKSDLYFEIAIKLDEGAFFIPAVVFYHHGKFQCFDRMANKVYPINEIYRTHSPDKESFKAFLNKLIEINRNPHKRRKVPSKLTVVDEDLQLCPKQQQLYKLE